MTLKQIFQMGTYSKDRLILHTTHPQVICNPYTLLQTPINLCGLIYLHRWALSTPTCTLSALYVCTERLIENPETSRKSLADSQCWSPACHAGDATCGCRAASRDSTCPAVPTQPWSCLALKQDGEHKGSLSTNLHAVTV